MTSVIPEVGARYRAVGRVVLRHIGEDRLLVPVSGLAAQRNVIFPVNAVGALLWEQLAAGRTLGQAARAVTDAYAVAEAQALDDGRQFVESLMQEALLEREPA